MVGRRLARASGLRLFMALVLLFSFNLRLVYALPSGETVVEGTATFDRSEPNILKINTSSDKLIVDYNSFSIGNNESVYFYQPSSGSEALNRVTGSDTSNIFGALIANGIIYLINPNGINIGSSANINAAGFIASTLNIANADFLSNRYVFSKLADKVGRPIINNGYIKVRESGQLALLGSAVANSGTIETTLGSVVLAAGEKITLNLDTAGMISVVIDEPVKEEIFGFGGEKLDSAVGNSGTILNPGGKVILTAKALNNVFDYAVNNTGVVEAKSLVGQNGVIELKGEGAAIVNSGTLNAGQVNVDAVNTEFMNKGKVIAPREPTVETSGIINIQVNSLLQGGLISADKLVTVEADDISVVLNYTPMAMEIDPLLNTTPGVVIQAPEVRVTAKQFGSSDAPLNIDAALTYINRTQGEINILDSLGIGTSVLLRGPPDGFGAIVYNRNTDLTLEAEKISLTGSQPVYSYGNITFSNLECTIPAKEIYFEAGKTYTILGTFKIQGAYAQHVKLLSSEQGKTWYIDPRGPRELDYVWVEDSYSINPIEIYMTNSTNRDNSHNWDPTIIWVGSSGGLWSVGTNWDSGVAPGAGDDVVFSKDARGANSNSTVDAAFSGTIGSLSINASYTKIITLGRSLTTTTGVGLTTGNITINDGTLNLGSYTLTVAGTLTVNGGTLTATNGNIDANGDVSISSGTLTAPTSGKSFTVAGNWSKSGGTFTPGSGTVTFDGAGPQTLNSGGTAFNNLTHSGAGTLQIITSGVTVTGNLTASAGTLNPNGFIITGNGTNTLSVTGTIKVDAAAFTGNYASFETITLNPGSTVDYSTASDQIVSTGGSTPAISYSNLTFSGAGTKTTAGGTLTIGGNWSVGSTTRLDTNNTIINLTGNLTGSGAITQGSGAINIGGNWTNNGTFTTSDTVTFTGATPQIGASNFYNLTINVGNGNTATLTGNATITSDLNISSGTLDDGGYSITIGGNFSNSDTFTASGTVTFNGTTIGKTITSGGASFFYLTINGIGGAWSLTDALTVAGDLTITNGTLAAGTNSVTIADNFSNSGTFTTSGTVTFNGGNFGNTITSGSTSFNHLVIDDGATGADWILNDALRVTGNLTITSGTLDDGGYSITIAGNFSNSDTFTASGTVTFNGTTIGKTITSGGASFNNLTFNGSGGVWTLQDALSVNGALTIQNGTLNQGTTHTISAASISQSGGTFTGGSVSITDSGNFTLSGGTFTSTSGNLSVGGNWSRTAGTFTHNSGTVTFDGISTISGSSITSFNNVTIAATRTLTGHATNINVAGNWTNNGTFTHNSGTVTFTGIAQSDITGNNTFYNLTIDTTTDGAKTVRFGAGNTQTITHTLVLTGASGKVLTLRSTTDGTQATLSIPSSITSGVSYLDVKDNKIDGANTITARYSEDSGNNTNWTITGAPAKINVETAANGSGTIVGAQDLSSGSSITVYSITRDSSDRFIENVAADSWALTNITGAVVSGDLAAAADNNSATLTGNKVGTAKIEATSGALTKNSSGTITVIPGPAATLVFVQQPTNTNAGATITPSPSVEIRDAANNIRSNDNITLSIGANAGGGALSGILTKTAVGGIATFADLSINKAGTGYTLKASLAGATDAISNAFNIISTATDPKIESQISNTIIGTPVLPDLGQPGFFQINTFNPGPVFLYHPLTPAETSFFATIPAAGTPGGVPLPTPGAGAPGSHLPTSRGEIPSSSSPTPESEESKE